MHVGRDNIGRGSYHRTTILEKGQSCDWCGSIKQQLYKYTWEDDMFERCPPKILSEKKFCDLSCFRSYFA